MSEQRFDRLENSLDRLTSKVDQMSEVVTALARIEEKHVAVQHRLDHHDRRLNKHSDALDELFVDTTRMAKTSGTNEWFIRILIASMVGTVAYLLRG
jgi:hemoglobin-like flavoprotein|tara:strand:- start:391 stop:681 length:291 start_codon:yes stop_codon:yes gene_type:complete